MLDIKYVIDHVNEVKENIKNRNVKCDLDVILDLYSQKNRLQQLVENLRFKRNDVSLRIKSASKEERDLLVAESKEIKVELLKSEPEFEKISIDFETEFKKLPNLSHPSSPISNTEEGNKEVFRYKEPKSFDFEAKDHIQLGKDLDLIDFESAIKVTGAKFYYLKNEAVLLELALVKLALDMLVKKGFTITSTPDLARVSILEGIGFNPRGAETNVYSIADSDLCLIGTAEITLGGMFSNTVFEEDKLPYKIAGVSHCFRTEAGAYGQFSKGLYRVHQFTKVEMFAFTTPELSDSMLDEFHETEKEFFKMLDVPFRSVDICTGDLGGPAYKKYDIEAWMPGRDGWGEVTSTSNCTDYQARRLNIRYKQIDGGKNRYVHMLNGTAVAVSRAIIAILENYQQKDGSILIPEVLRTFMGKDKIAVRCAGSSVG